MKWLIAVLACVAVAGCGGVSAPTTTTTEAPTPIESDRDDGFTNSDREEFYDWCVVSRGRITINCGGAANSVRHYVTLGAVEDCVVRNWKRMVGATTDRELVVARDALYRCSGMRHLKPSLDVLNALSLPMWPDG